MTDRAQLDHLGETLGLHINEIWADTSQKLIDTGSLRLIDRLLDLFPAFPDGSKDLRLHLVQPEEGIDEIIVFDADFTPRDAATCALGISMLLMAKKQVHKKFRVGLYDRRSDVGKMFRSRPDVGGMEVTTYTLAVKAN